MARTPSESTREVAPRSRLRDVLAVATWAAPREGMAHGFLDLDVTRAEAWCRARTGVSLTHVVGSAVALALVEVPDANSRVVLGRVRRRPSVDVSYVVDVGRGRNMTSTCVRAADGKSPRTVASELLSSARRIRRGRDPALGRAMRAAEIVPGPLVGLGMEIAGFVTGGLGRPLRPLRLAPFPLGSALVSSVGEWGIARAIAPVAPFARVGLVVVAGAAEWRPRVAGGQVVARRVLEIGVSVDHRLVDGAQLGALAATMRRAVERPWEAWPEDGPEPASPA